MLNTNFLVRQPFKYHTYINKATDFKNKAVTFLNIDDINLINQYVQNGYDVLPVINENTSYIISKNKLQLSLMNNSNIQKLKNSILPQSFYISTKYKYKAQMYPAKVILRVFNKIILSSLIIIVLLSLIARHIPLKIQSINEQDLTMVFCSSNGRILTPIPKYLPNSIIWQIRNHCLYQVEHHSTHNIFKDDVSSIYKIILESVSKDLVCCVIFRLPDNMNSFECETTAVGTCFSNSSVDDRQPVDTILKFGKDNAPSASFSFIFEREKINLVLKNNLQDNFALGRQAQEIEHFVLLQQSILSEGLKSKPSKSKFLSLLKSAYERLNYTAIVIVMVTEESEVEVLAKFCRVSILSDYYNKLIEEVKSGKFKDGDIVLGTVGSYRTGSHTITVESTKYFFFVSARADSNIIRSIEPNIHAILTMLVSHNHTHFISSKIMEEIRVLDKVWTEKNCAVFECVDGKLDWMRGGIGERKLDKKTFDYIYSRIKEALEGPPKKVIKFIVPMWFTKYHRSMLLVNGQNTYDTLKNVNVLTCFMRDVTEIYAKGIYENLYLNTNLIGAVMHGLQRVNGKEFTLDTPQCLVPYLGELPPKEFSNLTRITETKALQTFTQIPQPIIRLVKQSGIHLNAATVPLYNGDFAFFPELSMASATKKLTQALIYKPDEESANDVRVSFLDLGRDSILEFKMPTKTVPVGDWDPPSIVKSAPKCMRRIQHLAGSMYRKHSQIFLNAVIEAVKQGQSSVLVQLHEGSLLRPFMVNVQFSHLVITVVMISLESENALANQSSLVKHALDGVNPSGHIFEWIYVTNDTGDGIYTSTPGGVDPQKFSKASLQLVIIPEQRMLVELQIEAGYVDLPLIVKFDEPRWYISKGRKIDDGILHGICILVPNDAIPNELEPGKKATYSKYLYEAFNKLREEIPFDNTEFMQALDLVTVSTTPTS